MAYYSPVVSNGIDFFVIFYSCLMCFITRIHALLRSAYLFHCTEKRYTIIHMVE